MRILALDASLARCSVALVQDGTVVASRLNASGRGHPAALAAMTAEILNNHAGYDAVAVTTGPGSFTGLRAALALAQGLATTGAGLIAVTVAEALAHQASEPPARALWVAIDSRRGRIFLDRQGSLAAVWLDDLPTPPGPVALAGDAAIAVAAGLAARGHDVRLTTARQPHAIDVAGVAVRRLTGALPPLAVTPLYVDPPEAKLPAGGLRPAPAA